MPTRREEEERRIYQSVNYRGNRQEYAKRIPPDSDDVSDEFRDINPVYGCLIPCLKCCVYPCRAFFLTGKSLSQKRRSKKMRYDTKKPQYNTGKYNNPCNQRPHYNQYYSASSNIGGCNSNIQNPINTDGSIKGNLRHPTLTGNCITPICSGSSASFCTIQAEYPSNRRSILPSSSSYGPRRYVEKTEPDFNKTNQLTCSCLGSRRDTEEFGKNLESNSRAPTVSLDDAMHEMASCGGHFNGTNKYEFTNRNYKRNISENFNERFEEGDFYGSGPEPATLRDENKFVGTIFSSCVPCNYSDAISAEYTQGNFFVDN